MKFKENPALTIENAIPSEGPGEKDYFEFTIEGKNTYSKPIWYEIDIQHGEPHETRGTRIEDNLLAFKLVEVKDEDQEEVLIEKGSYTGLASGKGIYVNTIPAGTNTKITRTYRLYMWISSETIIGNTSDANYDMDEWNDVFASIKVNVTGDFNEKEIKSEIGTDVVKGKVVSNVTNTCTSFTEKGGLVAINQDGTLYQEDSEQEIREYRYVGPDVDNYIYFNCQDGKEQNGDNCEIWRILGIFKDESGAEHLKIVRNEILSGIFPETFEVNGTTYKIQSTSSGDYAYWNYIKGNSTDKNDWATGGLQYWLNAGSDKETKLASDGYMSYLSKNAKSMIENTKYYLGNIVYNRDTVMSSYTHEKGSTSCSGSCSGGDIWEGNQATWNGNIALMYPSDYGYTANSCNWNTTLNNYENNSIKPTSWLYQTANHSGTELLLSPSSIYSYSATGWYSIGFVSYDEVYTSRGVRPSLNLISVATIVDGEGTVDRPYQLNSGQ